MLSAATNIAAPAIAIEPMIAQAARDGAYFVFSLSGGKDSGAAAIAVSRWLDEIGHPRDRRAAIHADLGRIEWASTGTIVAQVARRAHAPLTVVQRRSGGLIERWTQRFESALARYTRLETYALIQPWSSSALRFCTSELKTQIIGADLARRYRGTTTVSVIGLRRDESAARANIAIAKRDTRFARDGNAQGTKMMSWNPIAEWSASDVYALHETMQLPLHEAYGSYGATRLGCSYCVLASLENLHASTRAVQTHDAYRELVALECRSGFSFQPTRWLGDVAPQLLDRDLVSKLTQAKTRALRRRALEAAMPSDLRFVKGWPPRLPTTTEAEAIVAARRVILADHKLPELYPSARAVVERFAELMNA